MIYGKHGQGTHSTEMSADKSAENTPNAPKCIYPNCLPKPKSLGFWWKKSVVKRFDEVCGIFGQSYTYLRIGI